jgi:hypothetical protein
MAELIHIKKSMLRGVSSNYVAWYLSTCASKTFEV